MPEQVADFFPALLHSFLNRGLRSSVLFLAVLIFFLNLHSVPLLANKFVFPDNFPQELRQQHKKAFTQTEILDFWHTAGQYFNEQGDFSNAILAAEELKDYAIRFRQPRFEAGAYEVMGQAYDYLGQLSLAVNYHLKALNIREKIGRKPPIAFSLSHMGDIYSQLKSYRKAEDYFQRALKLFKESDYSFEAAEVEYNLAIMLGNQGRNLDALELYNSCLRGFVEANDSVLIAMALEAIGTDLTNLKDFDSAEVYYLRALEIRNQIHSLVELSRSYTSLCNFYSVRGDLKKGRFFGQKAVEINQKLNIKERLVMDYGNLSEIEEAAGNFSEALRLLKIENNLRDTLKNQNIQEEIALQSIGFELHKIQYLDSLKKAESEKRYQEKVQREEDANNRKARIQYLGIFIFISLLLGGIFLIRRISLPVIWLEGGIFFTALLLFEFLYLILDPWVELVSRGTPIYKFGINLILGLLVFYAHNMLEINLKRRLIREDKTVVPPEDLREEE